MINIITAVAAANKAADPWYYLLEHTGKKHVAYCLAKAVITHQRVLDTLAMDKQTKGLNAGNVDGASCVKCGGPTMSAGTTCYECAHGYISRKGRIVRPNLKLAATLNYKKLKFKDAVTGTHEWIDWCIPKYDGMQLFVKTRNEPN